MAPVSTGAYPHTIWSPIFQNKVLTMDGRPWQGWNSVSATRTLGIHEARPSFLPLRFFLQPTGIVKEISLCNWHLFFKSVIWKSSKYTGWNHDLPKQQLAFYSMSRWVVMYYPCNCKVQTPTCLSNKLSNKLSVLFIWSCPVNQINVF